MDAKSPIEVNTDTFEAEVINSPIPVLVDFWAPWCAPCRAIAPVLEQIAQELGDKAKIAKVNSDENQDLAMRYQVYSIPNLMLFHNGEVVDQFIGLQPKHVLKDKLTYYANAAVAA